MAKNRTATLYIRSKVGYRKTPKRLADLPEGETYVLFWYEDNKRKSLKVDRFADAAQMAVIKKESELRTAAVTGTKVEPELAESCKETTPVVEAVEEYLSEVKASKAHKTHLAYSVTVQAFLASCKAKTIEAMTRRDVLAYTQSLRDAGLTPRTIANRLSFLRTFWLYHNLEWPMKSTDRVKYTEKVVEAYSTEDLRKLFAAATQEETELFQFFLCTGMREQEVMYATWHDVDFNRQTAKISEKLDLGFTPKDKEERVIPVPDTLVTLLKSRRLRYPGTKLIFPLPDGRPNGHMLRVLKRLAERAGLVSTGLHKFRKTFATMHHEAGVPARTIQRWLAHSSLDTTLRYLAGSDDRSESTRVRVNSTFACL